MFCYLAISPSSCPVIQPEDWGILVTTGTYCFDFAVVSAGSGWRLCGRVHGFWGSLQSEVLYWGVKGLVIQLSFFYEEEFPVMESILRVK